MALIKEPDVPGDTAPKPVAICERILTCDYIYISRLSLP